MIIRLDLRSSERGGMSELGGICRLMNLSEEPYGAVSFPPSALEGLKLGVRYDEIPLVFNVRWLAKILMVSYSTALAIMHSQGFPVRVFGRRIYRIYKEPFLRWLETEMARQASGWGLH